MLNLAGIRRDIVVKHQTRLDDIESEIRKLIDSSMRDNKTNINGGIVLGLSISKVNVQFSKENSLGMESNDRLEYAKMWFEDLKATRESIANDPGYKSMMKDVDDQMELYRKELANIDEEIKKYEKMNEKNKEHAELKNKKGEIWKSAK